MRFPLRSVIGAALWVPLLVSVSACGSGSAAPTSPGQLVTVPGGLKVEFYGHDLCKSEFAGPTAQVFDLVTFYPGSPLPATMKVRNHDGVTREATSFQPCAPLEQVASVCSTPQSAAAQAAMAPCLQPDGRARTILESNAKPSMTYELYVNDGSTALSVAYAVDIPRYREDNRPFIAKGVIMSCSAFRNYADLSAESCGAGDDAAAVMWTFVPNKTMEKFDRDIDVEDVYGGTLVASGSSSRWTANPADWRKGTILIDVTSFDSRSYWMTPPFHALFNIEEKSGSQIVSWDQLTSLPYTPGG